MASHTVDWRQAPPEEVRGGAVTIGNFDGVHRGHASLIAALRAQAARVGGPAVCLTFDPHPLALLRPGQPLTLLTTPADRAELLQQLGADHVLTLRATPELLGLSAADFFREVLLERLAVRALAEGSNFGFGHNREGNIEVLGQLCAEAGVELSVVPPLLVDGSPVSSSRIRGLLLAGDVAGADALLGRTYRVRGVVGTGQKRGRTIGFPTANLEDIPTLVPGDGVYAVRAWTEGPRQSWAAAANVGPNPTFGEEARKVEVHLIGFQGDLYGAALAVDFLERLRPTVPFAGVAELTAQLQRDVEAARRVCEQG